MTISSTTNRVSFAGNGVTVAFATSPVVFFDSADLTVYDVVTATGVSTLKTLTTDYTVTGGSGATGTVTMLVAPATGHTLLIVRDVAITQGSDLVNNDASDAEVIEDAFDRLTMIAQQLDTRIDRSLVLADSDVSGVSPTVPTPAANSIFGWNAAGTALINYVIQAGTSLVDLAASTGATLVGWIHSGTGAILRTISAKLRDTVHVKDYGAVCDGVTDDTAAIAAAIAANPNRIIQVSGTPLLSSTLAVTGRVKLQFEGGLLVDAVTQPPSYFIKKATMSTVAVTVGAGSIISNGGIRCLAGSTNGGIQLIGNTAALDDFSVVGAGSGAGNGVGIRVCDDLGTNTNSWSLRRCLVTNMSSHGIYIHDGSGGAPDANAGSAISCRAFNNGGDGLKHNNASLNTIIDFLGEANTGAGLRAGASSTYLSIIGGDRESNTAGQIILDSGSANTSINIANLSEVTDSSVVGSTNTTKRLERLIQNQSTFTATLFGSSTSGTQTYSVQIGHYYRVGDYCFISIEITLSALDAATAGDIRLAGLPFAMDSGFTGAIAGLAVSQWGGFTLTANFTQLCAQIRAGEQVVRLVQTGSGQAAGFVTKAMAGATSQANVSGWYPIAKF